MPGSIPWCMIPMENLTFLKTEKSEFSKTLRKRVDDYFAKSNTSKYGNTNMVAKTIFMLSVLFLPIIVIFPNVCHVHYKKLSKIVSETAKEFDTPYLVKKNFLVALWDHAKMLRQLGKA